MIYKCIGISSSITELDVVLHDYEFLGSDGSTILLANILTAQYVLGIWYTLALDVKLFPEAS
jgi:hypothetical protein